MMKQKSFVLTSRRIFCKARHGRNVFVCLCSPQGVVKEQSAFISLSKHILKMCFDGMTNSPLRKVRKGVRTSVWACLYLRYIKCESTCNKTDF